MTKIYVFAVYTGKSSYGIIQDAEISGDTMGYAIDFEKKLIIGEHFSSGVNWTKHDMGITSNWKHDTYKEYAPDGYELIWLGGFNTFDDAMLQMKQLD
jgi:hypothetical protein